MNALVVLAIGGMILTAGDIVFKFYVEKSNTFLYGIGLGLYIIGLLFLIESFKTKNIVVASIIFEIFNTVTLLIASGVIFKEYPTPLQLGGVVVGVVAIVLLA